MWTAVKIILILLVVPFAIGLLPAQAMASDRRRPSVIFLSGYLCMLALFQLIAIPLILYQPYGYELLTTLYSLALGLFAILGVAVAIWQCRRGDGIACLIEFSFPQWRVALLWLAFFAFLAFHFWMNFTHAPFDGDDAYYVAHSVASQQTGTLYRVIPYTGRSTTLDLRHALAPLPIWEAYVGTVTGVHASIVAHTLLQAVFTALTYLAYALIGKRLCRREGQLPVFLILMGILQIWGNTSLNTPATFFVMRTWQGKSVVANLVIPCLLWLLLWIFDDGDGRERERKAGLWILLFVTNITAALCTSMGCLFAALLLAVAGIILAICKRSWATLFRLALTALYCVGFTVLYFALN